MFVEFFEFVESVVFFEFGDYCWLFSDRFLLFAIHDLLFTVW